MSCPHATTGHLQATNHLPVLPHSGQRSERDDLTWPPNIETLVDTSSVTGHRRQPFHKSSPLFIRTAPPHSAHAGHSPRACTIARPPDRTSLGLESIPHNANRACLVDPSDSASCTTVASHFPKDALECVGEYSLFLLTISCPLSRSAEGTRLVTISLMQLPHQNTRCIRT